MKSTQLTDVVDLDEESIDAVKGTSWTTATELADILNGYNISRTWWVNSQAQKYERLSGQTTRVVTGGDE